MTNVNSLMSKPVLITGGAGFIGCNLADSFLSQGRDVIVFDTLERPGVADNLDWLQSRHGRRVIFQKADIRDEAAVREAVDEAGAVAHLAAQVAVTTSFDDPARDFAVNMVGTLNVLEALRRRGERVPLAFASTNKVYGDLSDLAFAPHAERCEPADPAILAHGIDEDRPLDFRTPYGCSKGAADQYVLDYARSFHLPACVLRMSCVYGPRQFGVEDQGWLAHFMIRALDGEPIVIYGDGRQVRDLLHVADAVSAYRLCLSQMDGVAGRAFNLGGGPENAVSLRQALAEIEKIVGRRLNVSYSGGRAGDQRYFVADTRRMRAALGWERRIGWREGLVTLERWLRERRAGADSDLDVRISA